MTIITEKIRKSIKENKKISEEDEQELKSIIKSTLLSVRERSRRKYIEKRRILINDILYDLEKNFSTLLPLESKNIVEYFRSYIENRFMGIRESRIPSFILNVIKKYEEISEEEQNEIISMMEDVFKQKYGKGPSRKDAKISYFINLKEVFNVLEYYFKHMEKPLPPEILKDYLGQKPLPFIVRILLSSIVPSTEHTDIILGTQASYNLRIKEYDGDGIVVQYYVFKEIIELSLCKLSDPFSKIISGFSS